ncbi:MAG: flavin reductase family protein [Candidatus Cloacimonadota bacterium]|nr:flavin reductase family protein [Candidatus Cloacimonadota bacterium]
MKQCEYKQAVLKMNRPSRIALAVSKLPDKPANVITLGWFMRTSIKPPMFAISVGLNRYSYQLLSDYRKFVIAFPSIQMADQTLKCGQFSGKNVNKIEEFGINIEKGKLSDIPILTDAVANFECKTISQIRSGDHTIFIGEVKYSWINENNEFEQLFSITDNDKYKILANNEDVILGKIK